ncbi:hypothetical protein BBR47_35030 [Brevibacillus brevis NBRC 100599]|uniref:Uncharacterized protein n=1 Tax=Brevibacillus brevis (strain 47 / JCM 6285 / NBRC 100599) TaxID=358681 RepID=C0ZFC1_BREBN|nr:hypothetical protein BBR47_35030 [Brevibacillus brevis NBRC 100599]
MYQVIPQLVNERNHLKYMQINFFCLFRREQLSSLFHMVWKMGIVFI